MGYNVLFETVLDGTLFGKWPHTGIWTCLLSQADRHGVIDKHPNLLAAKIGVPVEQLLACIHDFMQPDPGSRTKEADGRRMELIDPGARDWGWRVINHGAYREKARKAAYDAERTASGADAARKREQRSSVPTCPDASRSQTPDSRLQTTDVRTKNLEGSHARPRKRCPEDFQVTDEMRAWASQECPSVDVERETAKFRDHQFRDAHSDWVATWRNWLRKAADLKPSQQKTRFQRAKDALGPTKDVGFG